MVGTSKAYIFLVIKFLQGGELDIVLRKTTM